MKGYPATIIVVIALGISTFPYKTQSLPTFPKDDPRKTQLRFIGSAEGKSYFSEASITLNWSDARQFCINSDMHLASITSVAQQNILDNAPNTFTGDHWTGGRDSQKHSQFAWDFNNLTLTGAAAGPFHSFFAIQTCVFYAANPLIRQLYSYGCTYKMNILCEIINK